MSNCDVCIGGEDYYFLVSDVGEIVLALAEKCLECGDVIEPGQTAQQCNYATAEDDLEEGDDDTPDYHYTCMACAEIRTAYTCEGSEMFGSMWESLGEVSSDLKMAGECWDNLSATGKAKLMEHWRKWKGLTCDKP